MPHEESKNTLVKYVMEQHLGVSQSQATKLLDEYQKMRLQTEVFDNHQERVSQIKSPQSYVSRVSVRSERRRDALSVVLDAASKQDFYKGTMPIQSTQRFRHRQNIKHPYLSNKSRNDMNQQSSMSAFQYKAFPKNLNKKIKRMF